MENANIEKIESKKITFVKKMGWFHKPVNNKYLIKGEDIWNTMLENMI